MSSKPKSKSGSAKKSSKPATPVANVGPSVPLEAQIMVLEQKQAFYKKKVEELSSENSILSLKLETSVGDHRDAMQYLELELTKARAEVDVERDRTQSVAQELEALRAASTAALGESQRGMTAEIEDWKTQYQQCKQELDRLVDFISVKATMETEMQALKQQIETQEREFKDAVHATERKLIQEKSQIKKEMIQQVNDITTSFRDHSVKEMAEATKTAIKENIIIKDQLHTMTKRLSELLAENEKLRTQNKRFRELNQDLDQSQESMSKKYATNQKFLRILAQKLRGNDDVLEDALKKYGVELASMQILGGDAKRARFLFMELVKSMAELAGVQAHVAGAVGDKPLSNDVLRLSDEIRKMSVDPNDAAHIPEKVEELIVTVRRMVLAAGKRRIDQRLLGGSQRMLGGSMGRSSTNMLNGSWNGGLSAQPKKSSLGKQASLAASNSGLVTLSVSIADAQ